MAQTKISLHRKSIAIIGIPLLCVAFFAIYLLYKDARQQNIENLISTLTERTARQASELNLYFGQIAGHANSLATLFSVRKPGHNMAHWKLAENIISQVDINGIACAFDLEALANYGEGQEPSYILRDGQTLRYGYFTDHAMRDYSFRDWFMLPQLAGKGIWTDPLYSPQHDSMIVNYGAPFYADRTFLGVITIALSVDKIRQRVADINLQGSNLILLSQFGTVVVHPNKDEVLRHTLLSLAHEKGSAALQAFAYSLRKKTEAGVVRFDEGFFSPNEYVAYAPVPQTDWILLSTIPESTMLTPLQQTVKQGVIFVLLVSLLLFCIIYILETRTVVRPLQRLEEAARAVAKGNFNVYVPETSSAREIYSLEKTFNTMVIQLHSSLNNEIEAGKARSYAEEASKAKSDFLARMSHEIRTPMNAILGLTYLALKEKPEDPHRTFLLKIQRSSKGMLAILNDILDFSKIEAGKLELETAPFSLRDVAQDLSDMFHAAARDKGLTFSMQVEPSMPQYVAGDPLRISQILINLCNNAMKFTERGHVCVRVAEDRTARAHTPAGCYALLVRVEDSGIGVPEAAQKDLFEKFTQADASTTRRFGGTGLGLAICQLLTDLMGGKIELESSSAAGSVFCLRLTLPVVEDCADHSSAQQNALPEEKQLSLPPNARILVAEDNEINQEIIGSLLASVNLSHHIAGNGQEALQALEQETFDLILMDMQMPVMDGITATQELRKRGFTMPVLALTANALQDDRERCLKAGMDAHIAKPIEPPLLYAQLAQWLSPAEKE